MISNVVSLNRHQFSSLKNQMKPVYAQLLINRHLPKEQKEALLPLVLRDFFVRLRQFRLLSIDELSKKCGISAAELESFENGKSVYQPQIGEAYVEACKAHNEFGILDDQIQEFRSPGLMNSRQQMAYSVLKQKGILIPGVDYKSLHARPSPIASMVEFRDRQKEKE